MIIKKKSVVESLPLSLDTVDKLYPLVEGKDPLPERELLTNIINLYKEEIRNSSEKFRCYIEKKAFDAFLAFADEAYKRSHNEATGIIMGYYLHQEDDPSKKIVVATNFIQANGPATSVTCTISYDDNIRYDNFCTAHSMHQLVWIHSHPGYGCFYSGTDSSMLSSCFYAAHQIGVVVDNLRNEVMGFKMIDGEQKNENVFGFSIDKSLKENCLDIYQMFFKPIEKFDSPVDEEIHEILKQSNQGYQEDDTKKKRLIIKKEPTKETKKDVKEDSVSKCENLAQELNHALSKCNTLLDSMIKLDVLKKNDRKNKISFWSITHPINFREILIAVITISVFLILYLSNSNHEETSKAPIKKCQLHQEVQHVAQPVQDQKTKRLQNK